MAYKHLTFNDRLKIEAWQRVGVPPKAMAHELGVHISTVYRELQRGQYERLNTDYTTAMCYSPDIAHRKYRESLKAKGPELKIGNDFEFAAALEFLVAVKKYSPGAALSEIKNRGLTFHTSISKTTFYRYISDGVFFSLSNKDLPVKRNKSQRKPRRVCASRASAGTGIESRPPEITLRQAFGDWEMDCVVGKRGTKKTVLALTERKTRFELVRIMKDKTTHSVVSALNSLERQLGTEQFKCTFKTITVDNGCEFQDVAGIEKSCKSLQQRTALYFCHPYSAYERGSNENQNKLIRRHYPKGADFTKVTKKQAQQLQNWINHYPRQMFNGCSAHDLFIQEVGAEIERLLA